MYSGRFSKPMLLQIDDQFLDSGDTIIYGKELRTWNTDEENYIESIRNYKLINFTSLIKSIDGSLANNIIKISTNEGKNIPIEDLDQIRD